MMPGLQAEERLAGINDAAAAGGNMRTFDRQRFMRELERAARGGGKRAPAKASPAALAAMGIGVSTVAGTPGETDKKGLSEASEKGLTDG